MDARVSERRRPRASGHDGRDQRDSSLIAGKKKTSAGYDVFFYLTQLHTESIVVISGQETAARFSIIYRFPHMFFSYYFIT